MSTSPPETITLTIEELERIKRKVRGEYVASWQKRNKDKCNEKQRSWYNNMTPEKKEQHLQRLKEARLKKKLNLENLEKPEKQRSWYSNMTPEKKEQHLQRLKESRLKKKLENSKTL
jgi:(2Fe-2S) ferredoxin